MAAELLTLLLEGLVVTSVAIVWVLALRAGWRRVFGSGLMTLLWLLVPLMQIAVLLPAPVQRTVETIDARMPAASPTLGTRTTLAARDDLARTLFGAWLLGGVALGLRFAHLQRRFRRRLGALSVRSDGHYQASTSDLGPVVLGLLRPRIVLPADFEQRFDAEQQALILAHESGHVRRGDVLASALAAAFRCVYWFNPLVHLAAARLRLDQEIAADADVLCRHRHARRRYAETLLEVQLAVPGLPVGCLWQSSHPLKERILMLKHPATPRFTHGTRIGLAAAIIASCCTLAWAGQPARSQDSSSAEVATATGSDVDPVTYRRTAPPKYPPAAAENRQSGKVLLEVLVGSDGLPRDVKVSKASTPGVFDDSAIASVKKWQFNPATKDGRPIESWVLVPICYATGATEGAAPNACQGSDAAEGLETIHMQPAPEPPNPG